MGLWNEEDKFFYDVLSLNKSEAFPLKIRSLVGLSPIFAVTVIEKEVFDSFHDFTKRMKWFQNYRGQIICTCQARTGEIRKDFAIPGG